MLYVIILESHVSYKYHYYYWKCTTDFVSLLAFRLHNYDITGRFANNEIFRQQNIWFM